MATFKNSFYVSGRGLDLAVCAGTPNGTFNTDISIKHHITDSWRRKQHICTETLQTANQVVDPSGRHVAVFMLFIIFLGSRILYMRVIL